MRYGLVRVLARGALVAVALVLLSAQALASHVRHVDISWVVANPSTAPTRVDFVVTSTWRTGSVSNHNLQLGDGSSVSVGSSGTQIASGTDASGAAYTTMRNTFSHTYSGVGPYTAQITGNARIGGLNNGSNGSYRFAVQIDLANGNTSGPQTTSNALISLQNGGVRDYSFPITDPDGDNVSCRIGTSADSAISPPSIGGNAPYILRQGDPGYIPNSCIMRWDLSGAPNSAVLHALPIIMESTHSGVLSSSLIDVLVLTSSAAPPVCTGGGNFNIAVG